VKKKKRKYIFETPLRPLCEKEKQNNKRESEKNNCLFIIYSNLKKADNKSQNRLISSRKKQYNK
jgi:hypothetical protein